ncbi:MAG: amidohydrolase family protein [Thermoplasmata archaeon]
MTESTDGAWVGGRVFTGDAFVEGFVVEGGRIVQAGTEAQVRRQKATGTPLHDLHDRVVIPGLIDAHLHLMDIAQYRQGVDLRAAGSVAELTDRARRWAEQHPRGPIVGRGWDHERFTEGRYPESADLDRISIERPIALFRVCGHVAVVNQRVLEVLGIDRGTPDPAGGRIGRGTGGEPNGILFDAAMSPIFGSDAPSLAIAPDAIRQVLADAARVGLTTVASLNVGVEEVDLVRRVAEQGPLPTRVRFYLTGATWEATRPLRDRPQNSEVRILGGKMFADGSFGARTARLSEPYADAPGECGVVVRTEEQLTQLIGAIESEGLTSAVHAIGDQALAHALGAFEQQPRAAARRIEHAALVLPGMYSRLDRLRPHLVVQPDFVLADWWLGQRLGPERQRWAYPFKTLLDRGHILAGSSDAPFGSFDPSTGLRAAVVRTDETGRSANATVSERLSIEEAVQLYTRFGGIVLGEPELGRLAAGNPADFVVLDAPQLTTIVAPRSLPVASTWKEGRLVYSADAHERNT